MNRIELEAEGERALPDASDVEALFAGALEQFRAGRLTESARTCRQILSVAQDHADSLHLLGLTCHQAGKHDLAASLIAAAIECNGVEAAFHNNLGGVFLAQGRLDEAILCYREALDCNPDYAEAHNNLGIALQRQGKLDRAVASFREAVARKPDYGRAYYNMGVTLEAGGRLEEAMDAYSSALAHEPSLADAHFALGSLLDSRGDSRAAATHLRRCLDIDPEDPSGAALLLARAGLADTPAHASDALLLNLYSRKAQDWDATQGYRAHELVSQTVRKLAGAARWIMLDAGCGTGLVGALVRDLAIRLDGVDLSPGMLAKAYQKEIYSVLYEGDLVSFMESNPKSYDLIASAATLIHFGELEPVLRAAWTALRKDGLFVFSLYSNDAVDSGGFGVSEHRGLARGGCFSHGSEYVERAANSAGFSVEGVESGVHESNPDAQILGFVFTLRRLAGNGKTSSRRGHRNRPRVRAREDVSSQVSSM